MVMKITACEKSLNFGGDWLRLFGRLLLSLIFLHEAISILLAFPAAAAAIGKVGVPPPLLALTVALQLGAGLMLALGWHGRPGAIALGLFCLATAFLFHTHFENHNEMLHFEKDLAIAGGMFALAAAGTGRLSLDRRL
jgi:putative oxidoreductase